MHECAPRNAWTRALGLGSMNCGAGTRWECHSGGTSDGRHLEVRPGWRGYFAVRHALPYAPLLVPNRTDRKSVV